MYTVRRPSKYLRFFLPSAGRPPDFPGRPLFEPAPPVL
nr:MAG TPA: hypothetical protein [Caudoviricetes sp.]